jgi:translocator protein
MTSATHDFRKPRTLWVTVFFVALVMVVGGVIGVSATPDAWYQALAKPPFNPPNWIFGPVWSVLYVLIGIAGARSFLRAPRSAAMALWVGQMLLNWIWSPTWFGLHMLWPAFAIIITILALIIAYIAVNWRVDRTASLLFVPYALWVAFASTLNLSIALLN